MDESKRSELFTTSLHACLRIANGDSKNIPVAPLPSSPSSPSASTPACTWVNNEDRPGPKVEEASLARGGVFGLIGSYLDEGLDLRTNHRVS